MCKRWVGDWTNSATYWPPVPLSLGALLSRSAWLLNRGPRGPIPLLRNSSHCIELQQLTPTKWTSCRTGLYHCLTPSCFLWASQLHPSQPIHSQGYTLISSTGCTCSLIIGWVGGQYVTSLQRLIYALKPTSPNQIYILNILRNKVDTIGFRFYWTIFGTMRGYISSVEPKR